MACLRPSRCENITDWRLTIFGLMILFVVYYLQDGIVGFVRRAARPRRAAARRRAARPPRRAGAALGAQGGDAGARPLLDVEQVADAVRRPEGARPGRPARAAAARSTA